MEKTISDVIMLSVSAGVAGYTTNEFSHKVAELYLELAKMIPVFG